jgi:hypothetical protein
MFKSLLILLALGLVVQGLQTKTKIQQLSQTLSQAQVKDAGHNCSFAIARWKYRAPANFLSIIGSNVNFTDATFPQSDALYWSDYPLGRFTTLAPAWVRPRDRIPTATIVSGLDISDIK